MTKLLKKWGRAAAGLHRHRKIEKFAREMRELIGEVERNYCAALARDLLFKLDELESAYESEGENNVEQ
jgi:molecular chaperone GrpE (heat shock protein)